MGWATSVSAITREHLETFLVDLAERPHQRKSDQQVSAAYVNQRYRIGANRPETVGGGVVAVGAEPDHLSGDGKTVRYPPHFKGV
jgi:hypothetical protein